MEKNVFIREIVQELQLEIRIPNDVLVIMNPKYQFSGLASINKPNFIIMYWLVL